MASLIPHSVFAFMGFLLLTHSECFQNTVVLKFKRKCEVSPGLFCIKYVVTLIKEPGVTHGSVK